MARFGTTKYHSNRQEKSVAKAIGGKLTIASGALSMKGDVRSNKYLVECKTTKESYYSLSVYTWEKIYDEACRDGLRIPLLIVDTNNSDRIVVFRYTDFSLPMTEIDYDISLVNEVKKSVRIGMKYLDEKDPENIGFPVIEIHMWGKRVNRICYMRFSDFCKMVGEEVWH